MQWVSFPVKIKLNKKEVDSLVAIGQPAPDFSLPGTNGKQVSLADFKGKKLVLFFYPKDNTPG